MNYLSVTLLVLTAFMLGACNREEKFINYKNDSCADKRIENQFIVRWKNKPPQLIKTTDVHAWIKKHDSEIISVEPNYRLPNVNLQPLEGARLLTPEYMRLQLGVTSAWQKGFRGQGVTIALVDSGVDLDHPEIKNSIALNSREKMYGQDGLDNDDNGLIDDIEGWNFNTDTPLIHDDIGHGTAMAGLITSEGSLSLGIAPSSKLVVADFINENGGNEYEAFRALNYSLSRGAKIINNSWSINCSELLESSFNRWSDRNVIFVNASGNESVDVVSEGLIPSSLNLPNHINVGSADQSGQRSVFSGHGKTVKIFAPGEWVPTLSPSWYLNPRKASSGTSVSTAIVSGAAAIVWSAYPQLSAPKIIRLVVSGADRSSGEPLVNVERSLELGKKMR